MERLIIAVVLILSLLTGYSKDNPFLSGQINLRNGDAISGLIKVPKAPSERKIEYKKTEDSGKASIDVEQIETINFHSKSGKEYVFECLKLDLRPKKDKIKIP